MDQIKVFESLKNSFNSLWQYKIRGESLEVITPYSTTNNLFISVFITERNDEFIVSDGGWLSDGVYDTTIELNDHCFTRLYYHYENFYNVKTTVDHAGNAHFYKKTTNPRTVSNIVYEMSNFISAIVSCSLVQFQDIEEQKEKEFFTREANSFIASFFVAPGNIKHNYPLSKDLKNIRFSTIIRYPHNKLTLVNYITGSNYNYFQGSIAKANLNFEIATKSDFNPFIKNKIAFINDKADGFKEDKLYEYLNVLETHTDTPNIKWSERNKIKEFI